MKVYKRLMAYARPYGKFIIPFFFFTIISVFFNVFQFALIIPLLNFLFDPINTADAAKYASMPDFHISGNYFKDIFYHLIYQFKTTNPVHALYFLAGMIVVAVVMTNFFRFLAQQCLLGARTLLVKRLREALFEKINHLHLGYFTKEHKGDLLSRLNGDVYAIESVAGSSIEVVFKEPYMLIGYFVALFMISAKLMLFTLVIIPVSAVGIAAVTKRLKKEAQDVQSSMGRMLTLMDETLMGMRIIRSFNATPFILRRFSVENDFYRKASLEGFKRRELAPAFSEASGVFVVACILVYGGSLVLNSTSNLQASSFIAFIAIFSQIIRPAKAIVVALTNIQQGQAAGERILELLDKPIEIEDKPNALTLDQFRRDVVFENVSFQYGDKPVLKNISFRMEKGRKIALVGPSGVGKSTIADLIPRFYEPTQGSVTIDGVEVSDYTMDSLRRQMSFVTQEIILFNDTIFNNIALGQPDARLEDVIAAAKVANAHAFIMETEDGYNTNIGDRGVRLSGGQRQRLSIARAVFKKPSILILDEATSALDVESEKSVQEALDNLMEGRTTLVIAHRLSTIREADEILIMEDGEIVERGNHYDLISRTDSVYKRLNTLQEVLQ
ncbi:MULTISPECIES: ABC transporter ATP-binding protein [Spirosoma]|uniref:ABC transporter ATP-binding protein n=1 Tax=Spirosoma sordidisoli TaxID=2502893 RepID=A0A4Q2ULM3_9BACT|nr:MULTISPECIES: ABC transporter ATP-binding protein [Spirosoma]RYC70126.1 ABC transporter ATP-binding protein [Spirosoma sordidisoli]